MASINRCEHQALISIILALRRSIRDRHNWRNIYISLPLLHSLKGYAITLLRAYVALLPSYTDNN